MATGDHGNPRCAAADPASASRSHSPEGSGTSPEKRLRRKRLRGRRKGPRHGRLRAGAGALGRRSVCVLGVGPLSCRPRVNPSDRQSVLPPRLPLPKDRSAQPGGLRLSSGAGAELQPRAAANHRASPRRLRTPPRGGQAGA